MRGEDSVCEEDEETLARHSAAESVVASECEGTMEEEVWKGIEEEGTERYLPAETVELELETEIALLVEELALVLVRGETRADGDSIVRVGRLLSGARGAGADADRAVAETFARDGGGFGASETAVVESGAADDEVGTEEE